MLYKERTTCRLCEGPLSPILSLGEIHLSTFLDTNDNPPPKVPLELVICDNCTLIQLKHTVSSDVMYSDYWYQSGLNQSMVTALKDVVEQVYKHANIDTTALTLDDRVIVDIGANDGTLLSFYPSFFDTIGFEPSNLYKLAEDKNIRMINDYFSAAKYKEYFDSKAKVITAIAMFYDLEDPHSFVADLKEILADDGIIVIQMMDLKSMMELGDFPNICHEHLEYYSLEVFYNLMLDHNLEVFDVEYNGVNGGSMRAYIRHFDASKPVPEVVINALQKERRFFKDIGDPAAYFNKRIQEVKDKAVGLIKFIKWACGNDQTVAVMGASTKGNTVLQFFGLSDKEIDHAAEVNPDKFGKHTVGSNIPIIPQEESLKLNPNYYLILPWGFIDNFIARNKEYLSHGGRFIVPLPEPRIISMDKDGSLCTLLI